jgi:glutamine---fructose-6-phosphate transaminase (isomerizing)
MSTFAPDEMIAVKWGSPMILGRSVSTGEFFFSSDAQALANYASEIVHLQDGDLVHITSETVAIRAEGKSIVKDFSLLDVESMESSKWDYEHYMLKEIYEQPAVLERILMGRLDGVTGNITTAALQNLDVSSLEEIVFVGCGTSHNAGMMGATWIQECAGIRARAEIASEYIYKPIRTDASILHVFLSQSWETADSIQVLQYIQERGGKTFGIVNVVGSSIAHLTDGGLFMRAGAEIGVASTKAFMAQLMSVLLLALYVGKKKEMKLVAYQEITQAIPQIPALLRDMLQDISSIQAVAQSLSTYQDMFFLGRHMQVPIAYEWSLKMKEISYIHSEAYPAGELKHGPLALISPQVPSILLMPQDALFLHTMSSLQEVKARGGKVVAISDVHVAEADRQIQIPQTLPMLSVFLTTLAVQILSYYTAYELWCDIDKPRNLAKSVTVK